MQAEIIIECGYEVRVASQTLKLPNKLASRNQMWLGAAAYQSGKPIDTTLNRYWQKGWGLASSRIIQVKPK